MNKEDMGKKMGQIFARAWSDDAFKQKLLTDTVATLKEEGIDVPAGMEVRAVENSDKLFHLVLPPKRAAGELNEQELAGVAGGAEYCLKAYGYC